MMRSFIDYIKKTITRGNSLFFLILGFEIIHFLYIIFSHRVGFHDTFFHLTVQYYFLNNAVMNGEIPQWIPYLTHGIPTFIFYALSGIPGFLINVLFYTGNIFKEVNFLPIYTWGIFFDKLVLLTGTWLLAKRTFSSNYTVFFVTTSVICSSVWLSQVYWNFYIYFAIPLIIYLLHALLDSGRWRYLFLALNLLCLQTINNISYCFPVVTLTIFLYFLFYAICNQKEVFEKLKNLRFGRSFAVSFILSVLSFALIFAVLKIGIAEQFFLNRTGRDENLLVPLSNFLNFAVNKNFTMWAELFLGVSPGMDYTLFIGFLGLPLIILGALFNLKRKNSYWFFFILTLLLFSAGTFISIFFYYSWPLMKLFRHLSLVSPIIRIFLCFVAGFGFEFIFSEGFHQKKNKLFLIVLPLIMAALTGLTFFLKSIINNPRKLYNMMATISDQMFNLYSYFSTAVLQIRFENSISFLIVTILLLGALLFVNLKKYRTTLLLVFLVFHVIDIYSYTLSETNIRTYAIKKEPYEIFHFEKMPYIRIRESDEKIESAREIVLESPMAIIGDRRWTENALVFKDQYYPPNQDHHRVDHWGRPYDKFISSYWIKSHYQSSDETARHNYEGSNFPIQYLGAAKIAGIKEEKIQFFTDATFYPEEDSITLSIIEDQYAGDEIFLLDKHVKNAHGPKKPPFANARVHLPYKIEQFSANHLKVRINNPKKDNIWLMYSDVWHPLWKATVNGKSTKVFKANIAYKAVQLEPGENVVHFFFESKPLSFLQRIVGINSLFWLGLIILATGRILKHGDWTEKS